jgi:hypothetical protein
VLVEASKQKQGLVKEPIHKGIFISIEIHKFKKKKLYKIVQHSYLFNKSLHPFIKTSTYPLIIKGNVKNFMNKF